MSDTYRMYRLLLAHPEGVHTHDLRKKGYSGNPSQRATDIEAKYGVKVQRERKSRNGRPGSVYRIVGSSAESDTRAGSLGGPYAGMPSRKNSVDSMRHRGAADSCAASSEAVKRSVPSMFDADMEWD